jgi:hypothetical protein
MVLRPRHPKLDGENMLALVAALMIGTGAIRLLDIRNDGVFATVAGLRWHKPRLALLRESLIASGYSLAALLSCVHDKSPWHIVYVFIDDATRDVK